MYYNGRVKLGVFPGTFNPPTVAHLALAEAALKQVDRVDFVLPRVLPHKEYAGVSSADRFRLVQQATADEPRFRVRASAGGLFIEIARELSHEGELVFLCGRDAAERVVGWDYGEADAFERMLDEFGMLVAARCGEYVPPSALAERIRTIRIAAECDHVSATEIRERIATGQEWTRFVPAAIREEVRRLYGSCDQENECQSSYSPRA